MIQEKVDTAEVSNLILQQVEKVTCLECCKYYVAPETATCSHTLCQKCWKGQQSCPVCAVPVEKPALKLNTAIQTLTEHVYALGEAFEKLFKIELNELVFNIPPANEVENDLTKNVTNWLLASQNQFSVAPTNSQQSSQQSQQFLHKSKIQIHSNTKKAISPAKVLLVPQPQDDWNKIELMPDKEDYTSNNENVVGPMDIQPFFLDEEYTTDNPRRSSRQKELKINDSNIKAHDSLLDNKCSSNSSNNESDKKKNTVKQNWNNVKKMRKEFSKLNKQNRNKLNVSIEMCKKSVINKSNLVSPVVSEQACYIIDENTPTITNIVKETTTKCIPEPKQITNAIITTGNTSVNHDIAINDKITTNENANLILNCNQDIDNSKSNAKIADDIINKEALCDGNHGTLKNIESDPLSMVNHSADDKQIELTKIPFFKKSALQTEYSKKNNIETVNDVVNSSNVNTDDIEITIKVGNTLTNIYIKKKKNDVELQITTDREVQTNLNQQQPISKQVYMQQEELNKENNINKMNNTIMQNICKTTECNDIKHLLNKTTSKEKNTNSAETVTGQFKITESEEKELSNVMKHIESESNDNIQPMKKNYSKDIKTTKLSQVNTTKVQIQERNLGEIPEDMEYLNDLDIFDSGSIKEPNVQILKSTKNTSSEILISTVKSNKNRMQQYREKRDRETNDENEIPSNKKPKFIPRANSENSQGITSNEHMQKSQNRIIDQDSAPMNYDVMSQVFANIDADIENIQNSSNIVKNKQNIKPLEINVDNITKKKLYSQNNSSEQNIQNNNDLLTPLEIEQNTSNVKECTVHQKYSENIFSIIDKDNEIHEVQKKNNEIPGPETQKRIENLLTPGMCRDLESMHDEPIQNGDVEMAEQELGTPMSNHDDSDKSVVEETPQKNLSFSKLKHKNNMTLKRTSSGDKHLLQRLSENKKRGTAEIQDKLTDSQDPKIVINLLDSLATSNKDVTVIETNKKETLETPLTINKFVGHIKHKSTPVARKSLNFANDDYERTLCPTPSQVVTTTQEKEFMIKAFEKTPKSSESRSLNIKSKESKKFCIAGSCLTSTELANVKLLCIKYKWTYVDKHTKDLTHLVVGVDEENKSQRSVKYMCALASGKWIISYTWVEKCLQTGELVDEEPYEVLDSTGDPGPNRSRTAKQKLFRGITFYCMPPFSVLDVDTLKNMLEAAGGCVVNEARGVRVTDNKLALLLAEPEHTQEDRFLYLTMELSIVPVNYEWVLNCLGSYTLVSVHELLLCPASLLPATTARWPEELLSREDC